MKFDKSRCYSAINADELKPGDKVIVSDIILNLKYKVEQGTDVVILSEVLGGEWSGRFVVDGVNYFLAYLVERKANCTNCIENGKECTPMEDDKLTWCALWKPKTENCTNCGNRMTCIRQKPEHPELTKCCDYKRYECSEYKPKTEQKAKHKCETCKYINCGFKDFNIDNKCDRWELKTEKKYRPFKDTDELIKVWCEKISQWHDNLEMPYIWVRRKDKSTGISQHLITSLNTPILKKEQWFNGVTVESTLRTFDELFNLYEFLDGSPCGVEEWKGM